MSFISFSDIKSIW